MFLWKGRKSERDAQDVIPRIFLGACVGRRKSGIVAMGSDGFHEAGGSNMASRGIICICLEYRVVYARGEKGLF